MMDSGLNILICHANRLFSDCLSMALTDAYRQQGVEITSEILDSEEKKPPHSISTDADFLIVDASLGNPLVETLIGGARRRVTQCKVILLIRDFAAETVTELAGLGANGCVYSESSLEELMLAIEKVAIGGQFCSTEVANSFFACLNGLKRKPPAWMNGSEPCRLTLRETQVLELIAWERLANKQIARRLNISLYTVKNHVHNILEKLGADDRHHAAEVATRQQILIAAR